MRITDRLKVEHGIFLRQLKLLERLAREGAPAAVLQAVAETIATAEERHSALEERLLYPALARILGPSSPPLVASREQHDEIRRLLGLIRGGGADGPLFVRFATTVRDHMESEIHGLFVLAEQHLTDEELAAMTNWNVEHIQEEGGPAAD